MAVSHNNIEGRARSSRMLRTALGAAITRFLDDQAIVEVMLNPDGRIWVDRLSDGLADTGETMSPADGECIVRLVAHHVGAEVRRGLGREARSALRRGRTPAFAHPRSSVGVRARA